MKKKIRTKLRKKKKKDGGEEEDDDQNEIGEEDCNERRRRINKQTEAIALERKTSNAEEEKD